VKGRHTVTYAIILSGADRYDGRWHDHPATSQRIAAALAEVGIEARIRACHPRAFGDLDGTDLLVANIANGTPGPDDATDADWASAWDALRAYIARGGPILALHLAAAAFTEVPEWREAIGGAWIPGTSMHPPLSETTIAIHSEAHPIVTGLTDIAVTDERYSYLETEPGNVVLATHEHDGLTHPMVWARENGTGRAVYDGLGHDTRSYDSPGRVTLLQREAQWLLGHLD
jgi:type 1 glutamine amidotransferase